MVQNNEGAWNYYSFGPGRPAWFTGAACLFGGYVKGVIYRSKLGTADGFDLTTFSGCADFMKTDATANGFANSASKKMDDVIYLTGDFSKSFEAADSLYTRQEETLLGKIFPIQYNLLDYNCMHFALDMLSKSSDAFTREQNKTLKRLKDGALCQTTTLRIWPVWGVSQLKALPNYREHPRRKRILAIIAGAVAGVLLVAFLVFWLLGTPTNKIVPQYDPALAIPAQEAGACFTAADGTVYSFPNCGR